jgi:hypothetical protein
LIDPVIYFDDRKFLIFRNIRLYISIWLLFTSYRPGGADLSEFPVHPLLPGKRQWRPVFWSGTAVRFISIDPAHVQDSETCTLLYQELFYFIFFKNRVLPQLLNYSVKSKCIIHTQSEHSSAIRPKQNFINILIIFAGSTRQQLH